MEQTQFNQGLLQFLKDSPTPFHATQQISNRLSELGFRQLKEEDNWHLEPGGYFVTRNQSSIIGFYIGEQAPDETGLRMIGAHTDSPCLKVKPTPDLSEHNYHQIGVEVYGGALLNPWFDRDLSVAGRVTIENKAGAIINCLIDFERPIATIPSLAIHLDREANNKRKVNAQTDIPPIINQSDNQFSTLLAAQVRCQYPSVELLHILSWDLSLYDTQAPAIVGHDQDFIASARLDNLLSCYIACEALQQADSSITSLIVCNDHEEVGSASAAGAEGSFLKDILQRIMPNAEKRLRALAKSMLISTDNAHGIHPNFSSKHDNQHGPILNSGPVIKINANQRYATSSETMAYFLTLCRKSDIPSQKFVTRTDLACGSTIGPITAKTIGVKTIDLGVPTFAMHSIRELAGVKDAYLLQQALNAFTCDVKPISISSISEP